MEQLTNQESVEAVTRLCVECGEEFSICRSCWRNQKCCSKKCSINLKNRRQRDRQKKYQTTEKGLEFGRLRQRRRYEKIKALKSSH